MKALKIIHFVLLIGFVLPVSVVFNKAEAQQQAFPGAEGCGMYTSGGRGTMAQPTTVFEVTSLEDTNTPGTLRYAVQASSTTYPHRTIVFRVSGTIHLLSKLNVRGNTTIAGQTAPGDGICLADFPLVISGDNVILRYLRLRMGDKNQLKTSPAGCGVPVAPFTPACTPIDGSGGDDALGNLGNKNIIIDHCTVSWSSDEALTVYRGDSVTMQWNFIEEPLNYSYHFETGDTDFEQHGYGGIWGSKHGSFHHNLIAHCRNRTPRWAGNNTYAAGEIETGDFRNNLIYNWGINNVYGGEGGNYNMVNNYYKYGPVTGSGVRYRIVGVDSNDAYGYAKYYLAGNYVDGSPANSANNWSGASMNTGNPADTVKSKSNVPFLSGYPQITTQSAGDAYESVLNGAGAVLPRRDTMDRRIVNDVRFRVGRLIDVQGGFPHGTPYVQTINAWPTLNSTTAPVDTDHDGMPDSWETTNALSPNDASDRQTVAANGYTNLENYLNGISNISPELTFAGVLTLFSQPTAAPSAVQTLTVSGSNLTGNVTLTAPDNYEISINGTTWVNSSSSIILTPTGGNINGVTLSIRLNAATQGGYAGNIVAVTPGQTNFYTYVTTGNVVVVQPSDGPATATWTLLNNPDPTVTGSVSATNQALGSAISGTQYGSSFGGVTGWQRAASTSFLPIGYNANSYVEYTVTPAAGKYFIDTAISLNALGGGTGTARMAIYYSTDGFATATSVGPVIYNGTTYSNSTDNTNSVSLLNTSTASLTGQQIATAITNISVAPGQTLSIRIYAWITGTGSRYFASKSVTLKGYTTDGALPLKLLNFSAALNNKQVRLFWNTTNEINTAKFEIESGTDGVHFKNAGSVAARNNMQDNSYHFTDPELIDAIRYYRLKMTDKDGSFSYSKIAIVNPRLTGSFSIFPNPAVNTITVTYPGTATNSKLQLRGVDGRVLKIVTLLAGTTQTSIEVESLARGVYYIKADEGKQMLSFIKQ
ncbi:MAG: T9SS type A sorting domain-containing protein [Ferruginibacter sp.]